MNGSRSPRIFIVITARMLSGNYSDGNCENWSVGCFAFLF